MEHSGTTQLIKVYIPDAKTQKCIVLDIANTVWVAKQVILDKVYKELPRDPLNYGVYMPPTGTGKLGKFLDDTLLLSNYALAGNIPRLEMKYKSRDYTKQISLNEKSITKANSKANQKKLVEHVLGSQYKKIDKLLDAGLDPNFVTEDGNTPLGIACGRGRNMQCIQSLLGGGAHIDFRGKDGLTPVHRGAIGGNAIAINALLSYGASPNYRDSKELTPLYHTAIMGDDTGACITLLRNRAELGIKDQGGWSELHHTSKYGHVAHAELFIRYGANINDQNLVGNTPLHVAASHGQRSCALMLLKRGADRMCTNFSGQTPSQVAILCGHHHLASEINDFPSSDIELIMLKPDYNEKARQFAPRLLNKSESSMTLPSAEKLVGTLAQEWGDDDPPIPEEDVQVSRLRKSSARPGSGSSHTSSTRPLPDVESLNSVDVSSTHSGSEPGTPNLSTPTLRKKSFGQQRERLYRAGPGRYIAVQEVEPQQEGDIPLQKGVAVEVTYIGKGGYWEGKAGGLEGWFPRLAIKEVGEEQYDYHTPSESPATPSARKPSNSSSRLTNIRDVVISRGNRGYGFAMRGVRATTTMQFTPTPEVPALQYVGSVEENGAAEEAGLTAGDFMIEVNGHNVTHSTHDEVVAIVRKAGDTLRMKIITPSVKPKSVSKQMQSQITPVSTPEAVRKEPSITEEAPLLTKVYKEPTDRETIIGMSDTPIGRTESPLVTGFDPTGWDSSQDDDTRSYSPNILKPQNKSVSLTSYSRQAPPAKSQTLPHLPAKDYPKLEDFAESPSSVEEQSGELSAFELALRQNKQKIDRKSLTPDLRRDRANTLPEKHSPLVVRKTAADSPALMSEQILMASRARKERAENNQIKMSPRSSPNPLRQNSLAMAISSKISHLALEDEKEDDEETTPQKEESKPAKKPPPVTKPKPQRNVSVGGSPGPVDWKANLRPASPLVKAESTEQLPKPLPSSGDSLDFDPPIDKNRPSSFIELAPPIGFNIDRHEDSEGEEFIPPPLPQSSPPPTIEAGDPQVFIFPEKSPTQSSPVATPPAKIPTSQSMELPSPIPSPPSSPGGLDMSSVVPPPEFGKRSPWSPASDDTPPPLPSGPPPLDLDTHNSVNDVEDVASETTPTPHPLTPNGFGDSPVKSIPTNNSVAPETKLPPISGFQTTTSPILEAGPPNETKPEASPLEQINQTAVSNSNKAGFETKDIAEWSVADVSDWLQDIKLGEYAESFEENEIIGEHLVDITKEDLKELGVKKLGHQKTILSKVAILLK